MYVKQLLVRQFRNYEELKIDLKPGMNIFYGDNAQGKTNLLESVYFCATGRSHRTSNDKECIRQKQEEALISLKYDVRGKEENIEIHLKKNGRKSVSINGYPVRKISELIGRFHVVLFSPEDLSLIKNSPQYRRKFIDIELSQVDPLYLYDLQQYYHVLRQRNQLMKDARDPALVRDTISLWDEQLVRYGCSIMKKRDKFIQELETYTAEIHENISGGTEVMKLKYDHDAPMEEEGFMRVLQRNLERDLRNGTTGNGIQHDDMGIFLNGSDVRIYGSQGQQRTSALSLKLAELKMMKKAIGDEPVLLLDDVMSELDAKRQKQLATYIKDNQTILTCTGIEDSIRSLQAEMLYKVSTGTVQSEEAML